MLLGCSDDYGSAVRRTPVFIQEFAHQNLVSIFLFEDIYNWLVVQVCRVDFVERW